MGALKPTLWAAALAFASVANGQQSGWQSGQVNASMCYWQALRAATIRDTAYLDGGYLFWVPGMDDGSYGEPTEDNNPLGLMYTLNFSQPFDANTNISQILNTLSKVGTGQAANNLAPNYYDGALLANDDEFFLYGGLLLPTDAYAPPSADEVLAYELYQYGVYKPSFRAGPVDDTLGSGLTRYVTYGGAANAPSENKGWYFGGMRSPSWGPIYYPSSNTSSNPTNLSNTLITLDMSTQQSEVWTNTTLPSNISSRANPELAWVPIGSQGILVALGGVTYPAYDNQLSQSQNKAQSIIDSPAFMSTIDIYDIAGNQWYQQPATGAPGQLAQGCSVVATAQDYSSFNIYYYGGFDGIDLAGDFNDDVWVLSLPSFAWTKVSNGTANHARAGHKCVKPYPDQMISIGGYNSLDGIVPKCLDGGIVQAFNLSSATWMDSYDPSIWSNYAIPEAVVAKIGGSPVGGATVTTPSPSGWAATGLAKVFASPYPTSKLTTYYPYASQGAANATRSDIPSTGGSSGGNSSSGGGTPSWVGPVLGVVLGLVFITAIIVAILLWRRRKLLKNAQSESSDENGHRIMSWMRGQTSDKAPTVTTEETPTNSDELEPRAVSVPTSEVMMVNRHEMADTPLAELLGDTAAPAELGDTALSPVEIINKHTHFGSRSPTNQGSFYTSSLSRDHASSISAPSQPSSSSPPPRFPIGNSSRTASPAIGIAGPSTVAAAAVAPHRSNAPSSEASGGRVTSDVSNLTDRVAHLRQMSDSEFSVSSAGQGPSGAVSPPLSPEPPSGVFMALTQLQSPMSDGAGTLRSIPVSPPTAEEREGMDYITSRPTGSAAPQQAESPGDIAARSPSRKSVFHENKDDMVDKK